MKKVIVLLSTYQGERFLEHQLDSLLQQDYPNLEILIRDDGSTDGTLSILERYEHNYQQITVVRGENVGAMNSFFALMELANGQADYVAFCDQDDEWLPAKVRVAVECLECQEEQPLLYCGKPTLVDESLQPLPVTIASGEKHPSFGNALLENICYGCTIVINQRMLEIVTAHRPQNAIMHDWWMYMTATCFGKVVYDTNSYLLYRQYDGNVVGTKGTYLEEWKYRIRLLHKRKGRIVAQAEEFERLYLLNDRQKARDLTCFVHYKDSLRHTLCAIRNKNLSRQRRMDQILFHICMILHLI
ncbi:MAG: glycosyltransferase family 2 protein [Lachnospiraceae bacterium]